jgi:opacity protein-like surface antigen
MKAKVLLFVILIGASLGADAQRWKRFRWEAIYGIGVSNFLGDLGGADQVGTDYMKDLEMRTTRPSLVVGLRFKHTPQLASKFTLTWGMVAGDDALTDEPMRNVRNLNFRAHIAEVGYNFEFYLRREKRGHRFKLRGVKGIKRMGIYPYGFFGIAGFFFNPQGKVAGKWVNLYGLGTEGQNLSPTRTSYSRFQLAIPVGGGLKWAVDRRWLVGIEYGLRKTFTDYIDDVSTTYFPNDQISQEYGSTAALAADPTEGSWIGSESYQQRGDPTDNDSYMFLLINANYKLKTSRTGMPKFR